MDLRAYDWRWTTVAVEVGTPAMLAFPGLAMVRVSELEHW